MKKIAIADKWLALFLHEQKAHIVPKSTQPQRCIEMLQHLGL